MIYFRDIKSLETYIFIEVCIESHKLIMQIKDSVHSNHLIQVAKLWVLVK